MPDLIDYPCPECGYEGPHPVHYDESVRQNVAECGSCHLEFGAPPSDPDA